MAAALLAAIALGCGSGDDPSGSASTTASAAAASNPRPPALCTRLDRSITGRVGTDAATELSGLVLSRSQRGVLWTHNDSGDGPRLLGVGTGGRALADVAVTGAEAVDWEAIAATRDALLIGDVGDNQAARESISVYRIDEPRVGAGAASAAATRYELRYPDGPRDAEALLIEPAGGALVIVEKSAGGRAGVYVADRPAAGAASMLRRRATLSLGPNQAVTAGDVSADAHTIVLRTYDRAFVWIRRRGERVAAALRRRPCAAPVALLAEGQGEALALTGDGEAFYTVPEGPRPAIRRYAPAK